MRVLTVSDGPALDLLAESLAEYAEARAVLAEHGQSYECVTSAGAKMRRARPEQAIAADAMRRAVRLLEAFGMAPAWRAKVEELPPPLQGLLGAPLDKFMRGRPLAPDPGRFFP